MPKQDKSAKADMDKSVKREMVEAYVRIVENHNMFPTRADLASEDITRDKIRHHFTNLSGLRKAAKEECPEAFAGSITKEEFTSDKIKSKLQASIKKHKTFVITTAVNGQWAHKPFLDTIDNYAKLNNTQVLILPSYDSAPHTDSAMEWQFDSRLANYMFVFDELTLNSNIHVSALRINAKQINPTTGLGRICQGRGSFIFSSPKQSLEYDPVSNVKYPHARMSTGACTLADYTALRDNSQRTSHIAEHDHIVGALIVEVQDDKIYHFRQIQADEAGGFCDLGKYYLSDKKPIRMIPKLIMGDYHAGQHDHSAVRAWEELIDQLDVEEVLFHDIFNGQSINHHEKNNIVLRARHASKGKLSLAEELKVTGAELERFLSRPKIKRGVIVKSNHDEFLKRWLENGDFKDDPINFQAGCKLADKAVDEKDTLQEGLKLYANVKHWDKLLFLNRDEDYKVAGIELGSHGDKGPNGSRGSKANLERSYGRCVVGHSHTPGILRGVYQVGTTSLFDLDYNQGASSWMHCSCLLYPNGQRQLINSIDGHWRLKRK